MIRIRQAVIVEGKYDQIRLSSLVDTVILTTEGFGVFKDKEKQKLLRRLAYERALPPGAQPPRAGEIPRRAEGLALYEIAVVGEPFRRLALVPARGEPGERRAQRPRRARAGEKAVRRRGARLAPGEGFQPGNVEISHIPARFHGNTSKYIVESILPAARRTIRKV